MAMCRLELSIEHNRVGTVDYGVRFVGFVSGFRGATQIRLWLRPFLVLLCGLNLRHACGSVACGANCERSPCIGCSGRRHRHPVRWTETDGTRRPGGRGGP